MKNLNQAVMSLDLTNEERNNFKQSMRGSAFDKHFNRLSRENLTVLKTLFEKQLSRYTKLFQRWGTIKLYEYCGHCEYALNKINEALS